MLDFIIGSINTLLYFFAISSLLTFIIPFLLQAFVWNKEQNLKIKYNSTWALVTGGSSGIGRALVEKLAAQGLNVVIMALDDDLLKNFHQTISTKYPALEFRAVGCDMGTEGYMDKLKKATDDIPVNLVFNNAGYVLIGLFADTELERNLKNIECNMLSAVKITHHFVNRMLTNKMKGAVTFTASSSAYVAAPTTSMYVSTKSFLIGFACSLAAEVFKDGIDVMVINPSPVDTNFYKAQNINKHGTLAFFGKIAQPPTVIASTILSSVGRGGPVREQGGITFGVKLLVKVLDYNFLAWLYNFIIPLTPEYTALKINRHAQKKKE